MASYCRSWAGSGTSRALTSASSGRELLRRRVPFAHRCRCEMGASGECWISSLATAIAASPQTPPVTPEEERALADSSALDVAANGTGDARGPETTVRTVSAHGRRR